MIRASTLERERRRDARRIPMAFTDLVAAAVQCLPSRTTPAERDNLALAVRAAEWAGAEAWPEPARELFERCKAILPQRLPVLPAGLIGPALDVVWPDPRVGAWAGRKDIGTFDDDDGPRIPGGAKGEDA